MFSKLNENGIPTTNEERKLMKKSLATLQLFAPAAKQQLSSHCACAAPI